MPGAAGGGFEKTAAEGIGCDRTVVALVEKIFDSGEDMDSGGAEIHDAADTHRDSGVTVVEKVT